jgi:Mg2+-importing ATPase
MDKKDRKEGPKTAKSFDDARFKSGLESSLERSLLPTIPALTGLNDEQVETAREEHGKNVVVKGKKKSVWARFFLSFVNPFTIVLLILAAVSFVTDYLLAAPEDKSPTASIIIVVLVW